MKLVLFRHAQKGITPFDDPALTLVGFQQAETILDRVQKNFLPVPTQAWVSSKIRTTQTLKAVCENYKVQMQTSDLLDLRSAKETADDFRKRVAQFLNQFDEKSAAEINETHFLCTHYDWIEEAMTLINSDKDLNSFEFSHWAPTQFIVFEIQNRIWKVIQKGCAHATKVD